MHVSLLINVVLANATCFTFTHVNIHSMKKGAKRLLGRHLYRQAYSHGIRTLGSTAGAIIVSLEFHQGSLPTERVFSNRSLSSKTVLHFWGRMEDVTHLKLPPQTPPGFFNSH